MSDNDTPDHLLPRLKERDGGAWRQAFALLYPVAWRGTGHARWTLASEDREEVAADALAEVARQIERLETWQQVSALTFVIARRQAVSKLRARLAQKRRAADAPDLSWEELTEAQLPAAEPAALQDWGEVAESLERLLAALGEPAAALVRGYTLDGLTYEELATRHRMPIGTVGVVIYRAMQRLRREVQASPKLMKELPLYLRLLL